MAATNCPRCGRVFMKSFKLVCEICEKELEQQFDDVRAYVKENPNSPIKQVSDATNVSVKRILQYVREGKIDATPGMASDVTCAKCGISIPRGRMCELCIKKMGTEVEAGKPQAEKESKNTAGFFTR